MNDLFKPQTENLFRGLIGGASLRDDDADDAEDGATDGTASAASTTLFGNFAVFNEWTEIDSWYEGQFLEQIDRSAFRKTVKENIGGMRCQFDHGYDSYVGGAPLGPITVLRDDAYYEVPLLDTDYNRGRILPLLQGLTMAGDSHGSLLGASFRFRVIADFWNMEPGVSTHNPKGLPERTIKEARVFEFGPVVFGAYPTATAMCSSGMRSLTDQYLDRMRSARSMSLDAATGTSGTPTQGEGPHMHPEPIPGRSVSVALNTLLQLRRAS